MFEGIKKMFEKKKPVKPAEPPKVESFEMPTPKTKPVEKRKPRRERRQRKQVGTFANNPPGTTKKPLTQMGSPETMKMKYPRKQKGAYYRTVLRGKDELPVL